jgi:hypothetical protein
VSKGEEGVEEEVEEEDEVVGGGCLGRVMN